MNAGGAETFLMKLFRSIDREQFLLDFCINVSLKNYYEDEILNLGGKLFRITSRSQGFFKHNRELFDVIKNNNYQFVLAVSSSATAFLDLRIAKIAGASICSIRSSNSNIGLSLFSRIIQNIIRRLYIKYADRLIAPSDLAAINLFGKHYLNDSRFVYLRNALNVEKFKYSDCERENIRKEFGITEQLIVFGHVGRFYHQKNHEFLIDIFNEIHRRLPFSCFLLVGSGELENHIKEKVEKLGLSNCVLFAGVRSDVNSILSAMDVFVFPSLFEGMPNTVIEAETSGLPCLISDTITRDANVLGLVEYLSLEYSAEEWAEEAITLSKRKKSRETAFDDMKKAGYDISESAKVFINTVFQ